MEKRIYVTVRVIIFSTCPYGTKRILPHYVLISSAMHALHLSGGKINDSQLFPVICLDHSGKFIFSVENKGQKAVKKKIQKQLCCISYQIQIFKTAEKIALFLLLLWVAMSQLISFCFPVFCSSSFFFHFPVFHSISRYEYNFIQTKTLFPPP